MKQCAGARNFPTVFTDPSPLFVVFRAAETLEFRKLAPFFKFNFKLRDIVVFRIVQFAKEDLVYDFGDLLRIGSGRRLRLDVAHEYLVWDRSVEELNALGNPLGFHLFQEK